MKIKSHVAKDIDKFYKLTYKNYKQKNSNSYRDQSEWNHWKEEVIIFIKRLNPSEIIDHWNKFKSGYLSDTSIPEKWKP